MPVEGRRVEDGEYGEGKRDDSRSGVARRPESTDDAERGEPGEHDGYPKSRDRDAHGFLASDVCVDVLVDEVGEVDRRGRREHVQEPSEEVEAGREQSAEERGPDDGQQERRLHLGAEPTESVGGVTGPLPSQVVSHTRRTTKVGKSVAIDHRDRYC